MSTFGKVLVGLTLLLIPVWIFLIAANAQKNKNWEAEIEKIQKQVAQLEQESETIQSEIAKKRDEVTQWQASLGQELALRRAKQAEAEQLHSAAFADLLRLKNLQATSETTQKNAEDNRDQRTAEVKAETDALEKERAAVKDLQAVNKEQMDRLAELRNEFVSLQKANKAKVSQLLK
ncbi:MAG: hypothetical protein P4L84_04540 [Isosphaeraceae bacterium]|nr:hypothetical protein [Isosphaeraceae bacterium]